MRIAVYAGTLLGMLTPLLLWGAYFLFVYTLVAIACAKQVAPGTILAPLWLASVVTLAATVLVGWGFRHLLRSEERHSATRDDPDRRLNLRAGLLLSAIAVVSTLWTALPILFITPCD